MMIVILIVVAVTMIARTENGSGNDAEIAMFAIPITRVTGDAIGTTTVITASMATMAFTTMVDGRNDGYGNNGGYNQAELNRGYQQGINTGASDGQRGQSYDPQRSRYFKNASTQAFREGFVRGYDQGYRQYSGYGNQRDDRRNDPNSGWGNILGGILGRP